MRKSFQWPCCSFSSISSTYELHGGRASGGCSDEALTVILKKDDMLIRMDASYLFLSGNFDHDFFQKKTKQLSSRVVPGSWQVLFEVVACNRAV